MVEKKRKKKRKGRRANESEKKNKRQLKKNNFQVYSTRCNLYFPSVISFVLVSVLKGQNF